MLNIMSSAKNYGELTIVQLKHELRSRKAKLGGSKKDLIARYAYAYTLLLFGAGRAIGSEAECGTAYSSFSLAVSCRSTPVQ